MSIISNSTEPLSQFSDVLKARTFENKARRSQGKVDKFCSRAVLESSTTASLLQSELMTFDLLTPSTQSTQRSYC